MTESTIHDPAAVYKNVPVMHRNHYYPTSKGNTLKDPTGIVDTAIRTKRVFPLYGDHELGTIEDVTTLVIDDTAIGFITLTGYHGYENVQLDARYEGITDCDIVVGDVAFLKGCDPELQQKVIASIERTATEAGAIAPIPLFVRNDLDVEVVDDNLLYLTDIFAFGFSAKNHNYFIAEGNQEHRLADNARDKARYNTDMVGAFNHTFTTDQLTLLVKGNAKNLRHAPEISLDNVTNLPRDYRHPDYLDFTNDSEDATIPVFLSRSDERLQYYADLHFQGSTQFEPVEFDAETPPPQVSVDPVMHGNDSLQFTKELLRPMLLRYQVYFKDSFGTLHIAERGYMAGIANCYRTFSEKELVESAKLALPKAETPPIYFDAKSPDIATKNLGTFYRERSDNIYFKLEATAFEVGKEYPLFANGDDSLNFLRWGFHTDKVIGVVTVSEVVPVQMDIGKAPFAVLCGKVEVYNKKLAAVVNAGIQEGTIKVFFSGLDSSEHVKGSDVVHRTLVQLRGWYLGSALLAANYK